MSFGLYLHTPFCTVKCGYCDFYSLPPERAGDVGRVGRALLREAERCCLEEPWRGRPIHSLYVGGGTPSLLPVAFFRSLLKGALGERLAPGAEITVEMNPESVRPAWARALAALGVNRASLGVQSFQASSLRFLDRAHTPGQAERVVSLLREAGVSAIGLDLIHQMPGQRPEDLDRDLDALLRLGPEHVSAYGLGWEPGTRLEARRKAGECAPVPPDQAARLFLRLSRRLRREGYLHYEVSNFARPGQGARHNSSYWWEGDVLAVGPSAVSAWTCQGHRLRRRFPADWRLFLTAVEAGRPAPWLEDPLDEEAAWLEALYLGLRWRGGVDLEGLESRFGQARVKGLLERAQRLNSSLVATAAGRNRALSILMGKGKAATPPGVKGHILRLRPEQWLLLDEWLLRLVS